ncbi:hypothetical protein DSO57_1026355 [Entomophthora muscae]|uniref:Uncharacterized protein n=1 Tax=Entomophthora muscae TaxID=34485 RepID=A0ACC2TPF6_9FUNG|nr:hypothetical protein DSO57_1026355 [Entomophthora muscae]
MYMYLPSLHLLPSHLKTQVPPGRVSSPNTALTLELADPKVLIPASPILGSTDPDASPLLCYPGSQGIEEDQLHRILTINALTRGMKIIVNAAIHSILILPSVGHFEDKSLAFATQNELMTNSGNPIVWFPDPCATHLPH